MRPSEPGQDNWSPQSKSKRNYVLSVHPLTQGFRRELEDLLGHHQIYLTLVQFRNTGMIAMVRALRALRADNFTITTEGSENLVFLPFLRLLAFLSRANAIQFLGTDFSLTKFSRWHTFADLFEILVASLHVQRAIRSCMQELKNLQALQRIPLDRVCANHALYLKTEMSIAVKAGGSVGHVAGVVNGFLKRGITVDYSSFAVPSMVDLSSITFHKLLLPRTFGLPSSANYSLLERMMVNQLERILPTRTPDFLYQRLSLANYAGVMLSRKFRLPLVLEYNGSEIWAQKHWGTGQSSDGSALAIQAEDVCLQHAHLVVTVSDVLKDELLGRGVAAERIVSYPNCVNPEIFDPARFSVEDCNELRSTYGISSDAVVVTFIGTFGKWHGVDLLVEAICQLVDSESAWLDHYKVRFLLVGDGLLMPQIRDRLTMGNYSPYVALTGLVAQSEAAIHLAASDILVSPHLPNPDGSSFFGSPTKVFEYMAMGKGIVASQLGQLEAIFRDSITAENLPEVAPSPGESRLAVMAKPGNRDSLLRGVRFMVERPAWRIRLGYNAREEVLTRYTWEHHVAAIIDRLRALDSQSPGNTLAGRMEADSDQDRSL